MRAILAAFICGLLFGVGLIVSQLANPSKVLGFLDGFGHWDLSLIVPMAGAVAASALGTIIADGGAFPCWPAGSRSRPVATLMRR
jgi:uncharacterized membrane protein YedE/YeeE